MAKYSDIKGFTVQTLSEDPINSTPASGVWASGANLNTGRYITTGCAYGYQRGSTLALCVGGRTPPENYQSLNEKYDGTSWTELGDLTTRGRDQLSGIGTTTSALAVGGYAGNDPPRRECESWDGSSWTEVGDLNAEGYEMGAAGVSNISGLVFGGASARTRTESWNGSSWTELADLNTGSTTPAGCGIQTQALSINGESDEGVESWNGSAWTEIADPNNTDRRGAVAAGSYTDAVVYGGGNPSRIAKTETYNGTSWTEVADMGAANQYAGGGGQSNGFAINYGGSTASNPTNSAATEEFQIAPITAAIKSEGQLFFNSTANAFKETITDFAGASWASGGNLNTARYNAAGNGLQTAGLMFGGASPGSPGIFDETEEFNGTSWTEKNDLNTGRNRMGGSGTVTAGIAFGGDVPPATGATERWDGSSWTEVNDMNTARGEVAGGGGPAGYTAAIAATGRPSGNNATEIWDGSSWTEVNDTNTSSSVRRRLFGTTTAAIICGGGDTGTQTTVGANTESWDGTSWTEVNNLNSGRFEGAACGIQTAGLFFGGSITPSPGFQKLTEQWNGTSWTERADLATAMTGNAAANSSPNAATFSAGGGTPVVATTEVWTAELANKTITAS